MSDTPRQLLTNAITSLDRIAGAQNSTLSNINTLLEQHGATIQQVNRTISELDSNVDRLITSYQSLSQERNDLMDRHNELTRQLSENRTSYADAAAMGDQIRHISRYINVIDNNMTEILRRLQQLRLPAINTDLQQINQKINTVLPPAASASGGNKSTRKKRKYRRKNHKKGGSKKMTGGSKWNCDCNLAVAAEPPKPPDKLSDKQSDKQPDKPPFAVATTEPAVAVATKPAVPVDTTNPGSVKAMVKKIDENQSGGKKTKRRHHNIKSKSPKKKHRINTNSPIIF